MQIGPLQAQGGRCGFDVRAAVDGISTKGYYLFTGSCASTLPRYRSKKGARVPDTSRTAYLLQCTGEDLYAVSHDITGGNIPRSPCTQGWRLCEEFQLGPRTPLPAPIMPEPILKGIADTGYYVWRGWSIGCSKRPAR